MGRSRGLAGNAGMVTMGYGGIFKEAIAAVRRVIRVGQSGTKRRFQEVKQNAVVWMGLMRVNESNPGRIIEGKVMLDNQAPNRSSVRLVEGFTKRTRAAWEDIKITVKRIK